MDSANQPEIKIQGAPDGGSSGFRRISHPGYTGRTEHVAEGYAHKAAAGTSAGFTHITRHGGKGNGGSVILLSHGGSRRSLAVHETGRFSGGIFLGKAFDSLGRDTGDFSCPGRCLFNTVIVAENVIFKDVESDRIFVDEGLILKILLYDNIGHGNHHRRICSRYDRYPFVGKSRRRMGMSRIDGDDLDPFFFGFHQIGDTIGSRDHSDRIPTPHDDQLGVQHIFPAVADHHIPVRGHHRIDGTFRGNITIKGGVSTEHCQRLRTGTDSVQRAQMTATGKEYALVAIGLLHPGKFPNHRIYGFVPGDPFVLLFPSFTDPFHGVFQTIRMVDIVAIGPAS